MKIKKNKKNYKLSVYILTFILSAIVIGLIILASINIGPKEEYIEDIIIVKK